MSILDRATRAVQESDRYLMFVHYAKKAEEFFGVARTRDIYQKAIEQLPNDQVCLHFMRRPVPSVLSCCCDVPNLLLPPAMVIVLPRLLVGTGQGHVFEIRRNGAQARRD